MKPWSNRALCRFLIWRLMALWQDMKSGLSSLSIIFYTLDMGDIHTWMTMSRLRRSKQCRGKELNFPVDWCPLKQSRDSYSHHETVTAITNWFFCKPISKAFLHRTLLNINYWIRERPYEKQYRHSLSYHLTQTWNCLKWSCMGFNVRNIMFNCTFCAGEMSV